MLELKKNILGMAAILAFWRSGWLGRSGRFEDGLWKP